MAESGERRMLFDTRGRRKNVIRVVYATLALLMGGSLFLTVGPFSLSELVGSGGSTSAEKVFDEQVERIEGRLAANPTDEGLLLSLTRASINAGNAQAGVDPQTGAPEPPPPEARDDFDRALEAWERYVKQAGDRANPAAAQLVAGTFFGLAERASTSLDDIEDNLDVAVAAQRIAAERQPSIGSLSSLAIYSFFAGDFAAGDKATKQAAALTSSKEEAKSVEKQLAQFRKNAKRFEKQAEQFAKAQQKTGREQLQNPFGGFGSAAAPGE